MTRRRRRERVAGQRPGLVHVPGGSEPLHEVGAPAERGCRKPTADDLAEDRQIRSDAVELLRAAPGDPEAGHHLVEHEQRARRVRERAERLQEPRRGRNAAHVPRHRLDEDRGEALAVALAGGGHPVDVVEAADDRVPRDSLGHARARRDPEGHHAGARAGEARRDRSSRNLTTRSRRVTTREP
jgi:hypothetical protein